MSEGSSQDQQNPSQSMQLLFCIIIGIVCTGCSDHRQEIQTIESSVPQTVIAGIMIASP